ncbi:SDR family NAD(P)-dependent oxidoreductase [Shinella sp. BYT-45]|uniref:SDR family NAD(P)-dependent oxidoreductase n=1 Tax=Shinella sp. BYT-45 TaxID=3377377 RepID=UPI00397EE527
MAAEPVFSNALPELVVVSGTASGLGTGIAQLLTENGVRTIGIDVAAAPEGLAGEFYAHVRGDVTEEATWSQIADTITRANPGTLGLVTSAAMLNVGTILDFDKAAIEKTMSVNFIGTALAFRALLPLMIARGGGPIVAVASIDATFAEQQLAVYAASKGAVRQLARTVAMDHARQGIRANVLSPGPMLAGLFERHMKSASDPDRFLATRANRQPSGRILDPAEVARAALFLLSDASTALNGAEIVADGGLTTSFDFRTGSEGASV